MYVPKFLFWPCCHLESDRWGLHVNLLVLLAFSVTSQMQQDTHSSHSSSFPICYPCYTHYPNLTLAAAFAHLQTSAGASSHTKGSAGYKWHKERCLTSYFFALLLSGTQIVDITVFLHVYPEVIQAYRLLTTTFTKHPFYRGLRYPSEYIIIQIFKL